MFTHSRAAEMYLNVPFLLKTGCQPECVLGNYPPVLRAHGSKAARSARAALKRGGTEGLRNISHSGQSRAAVYISGGRLKCQCLQRFLCVYRYSLGLSCERPLPDVPRSCWRLLFWSDKNAFSHLQSGSPP